MPARQEHAGNRTVGECKLQSRFATLALAGSSQGVRAMLIGGGSIENHTNADCRSGPPATIGGNFYERH